MITGHQYPFGSSPSKTTTHHASEERARTPNKNSLTKISQRESKSLARKDHTRLDRPFNGLTLMQPIQEWREGGRYFYLSRGNNHEGVRRVLLQRKGLIETNNPQSIVLFKWTQNAFGFKWHRLGKDCMCLNHFEFHRQITNKQRLVWNMLNFCESNKLNAFSYIPTTFIIDLTTGQQDMALHGFLKFYNRNMPQSFKGQKVESILLPKARNIPYMSVQQLRKKSQGHFYCKPVCPKTFFGNSNSYLWILKPTFMNRGRGVSLFSNLKEFQQLIWQYYQGEGLQDYQQKQGISEQFQIGRPQVPTEPSLQIKVESLQLEGSTSTSPEKDKAPSLQHSPEKKENTSQNKVEEKVSEVKPELQKSDIKLEPKTEEKVTNLRVLSFIVQKYIECPMLINQRKFDIRVWALLTQNYQIFFFKEGYLRFSSHKYTADNHKNPFIHLTNNSVQKHSNQFDEGSGNQMTLTDLQDFLPSEEIYNKIQSKIREMIWLSMCSVRRKINVNARKDCFQLFGYDFMIDQGYRTWLIEVNTNPAIQQCSSILKTLIPRMLDDMFRLTIDRLYNLKYKEQRECFQVKGFPDGDNLWELLGDFREGVNEKTMGKKLTLVRR